MTKLVAIGIGIVAGFAAIVGVCVSAWYFWAMENKDHE